MFKKLRTIGSGLARELRAEKLLIVTKILVNINADVKMLLCTS